MKHLNHEKVKTMHETADELTEALGAMRSWDEDINTEAVYEQAYADYKRLLGELCTQHAYLLEVTNERA